eukprot:gene14579-biopygen6632
MSRANVSDSQRCAPVRWHWCLRRQLSRVGDVDSWEKPLYDFWRRRAPEGGPIGCWFQGASRCDGGDTAHNDGDRGHCAPHVRDCWDYG